MARRHVVAVLVLPQATLLEFAAAVEVFGVDWSHLGVPWYRFRLCGVEAGSVELYGGYRLDTPYGLADAARADTLIVAPPGEDTYPEGVLEALVRAHRRGARIVSLCTGAFVLAAAGLLDGRRATTHWMAAEELALAHPRVLVNPNVLYVDDGDILTSAGTAASIDLCLHIVRNDYGAEIANSIARRMVVPPHRDGGQAQYIDHPVAAEPGVGMFDEALAWAQLHLDQPITLTELASRSAMSPRTFTRKFKATTGATPHAWLTARRVQLAQRLLETTDGSVDWIADRCGFGTSANLRLHFQQALQTSPTQYRRTFQAQQTA